MAFRANESAKSAVHANFIEKCVQCGKPRRESKIKLLCISLQKGAKPSVQTSSTRCRDTLAWATLQNGVYFVTAAWTCPPNGLCQNAIAKQKCKIRKMVCKHANRQAAKIVCAIRGRFPFSSLFCIGAECNRKVALLSSLLVQKTNSCFFMALLDKMLRTTGTAILKPGV